MTAPALILLIVAILVLWGGLAVSILALRARPELEAYPPGDHDDDRDGHEIVRHDT